MGSSRRVYWLHDLIREWYPSHKEALRIQASFEFKEGEGAEQSVRSQKVGYRFDSADGRYVLQVQHGGFTLSRLKPYETWENLFAEAKRLWAYYANVAQPQAITRVATRFINRIELDAAKLERCQADDWDGEGGEAISPDTLMEAEKLLGLLPSSVPAPEFLPEATGAIAFEWYRGRNRVYVISVSGAKTIEFAGLFGHGNELHGKANFEDTLPSIIQGHLQEFFRQ